MNLDFLAVDIRIILKTMYVVFLLGMLAATVFVWNFRHYIPRIVHDCLTGPDGKTYDPARVIGYPIIMVSAFIIICMNIYLGLIGKWDGIAFVQQIGGIFLVHLGQSAAILVKGNQEPKINSSSIADQMTQLMQQVAQQQQNTTPQAQQSTSNQPPQTAPKIPHPAPAAKLTPINKLPQ